ncbi:hypothetical protein [Staphylococcus sp. Marseille-Q5304]|uniref:hypothetical protein n=1 Tax=Staphylococcus sp. Marseille-Q5304 TaxID=2942200 RepID=UPI0020743EF6|nr:hypothetical protein [Staphylococcus sp. Marseille-Q5304]
MKDWKKYQIILFVTSFIFFIGFLLELSGIFSFGETFKMVCLIIFTFSTSIYIFEREKIASVLFMISTVLILLSLIFK